MSLCRLHCTSCLSIYSTITRPTETDISVRLISHMSRLTVTLLPYCILSYLVIILSHGLVHSSLSQHGNVMKATHVLTLLRIQTTPPFPTDFVISFHVRVYCLSQRKSMNKRLSCRCYKMLSSRIKQLSPNENPPPMALCCWTNSVIRTNGGAYVCDNRLHRADKQHPQ